MITYNGGSVRMAENSPNDAKIWIGTAAQKAALGTLDPKTIYITNEAL